MTEFKVGDRVRTKGNDFGDPYTGTIKFIYCEQLFVLRDDKEPGSGKRANGIRTWTTSNRCIGLAGIENWRQRIK